MPRFNRRHVIAGSVALSATATAPLAAQAPAPDLKGKAMLVVPLGFLSSSKKDQRTMRSRLLEDGMLDSVIAFPAGLLSFTSIPFALIIVDKGRDRNAPVMLVDAQNFIALTDKKEKRIAVDSLFAALRSSEDQPDMRRVAAHELRQNEYILTPARYLIDPMVEEGQQLGSFVSIVRTPAIGKGKKGHFVRIRDLKANPFDPTIYSNLFICDSSGYV